MADRDIGECDLTNGYGEGLHAEDASDDEGVCLMITVRIGRGFAQDSTAAFITLSGAAELHAWLGQWLEAKGARLG